jgi:hypothetical protein
VTEHQLSEDPLELLRSKRVRCVYCLKPSEALIVAHSGIEVAAAPHWTLASLGI